MEEEKARSYDLMVEKLRNRDKSRELSESEREVSSAGEEEVDLHGIRSKMGRRQKKK